MPAEPFTRAPSVREQRNDLVLATIMFVGAILSAALSTISEIYGETTAPPWTAVVYAAALTAPLAVRRRWPAPVAVAVCAAYFVAVSFKVPEIYVGNIAMFVALYTVGAWTNSRRAATIVRVSIIVGMFAWLLVTMYRTALEQADEAEVAAGLLSPYVAFMLLQVLLNVLYFGGAYYFGDRSWNAAHAREILEQRTVELEREREVTAAQAVTLDRVRIARELHDVVAHHVSVMGVQAGAARLVLDQDSEKARGILTGIEESARDAIRELRQLLETLRAPGGETTDSASTVTLDDIEALAHASTEAGLPTRYSVVGEPAPVPPLVAVNLYRIAQESLTNARRHAGAGATADVRVRYDDAAAVEVEVVNTGRTVAALRPGLGQLGMRERAAASGGTLDISPRATGGLRVRARVPLDAPGATPGAAPVTSAPIPSVPAPSVPAERYTAR